MAGGSRVGRDGVLSDTKDIDIPANYNVSRTLMDQNWRDEQQRILMQVCVCVCARVCVCVCVTRPELTSSGVQDVRVCVCGPRDSCARMCVGVWVFAFVVRETHTHAHTHTQTCISILCCSSLQFWSRSVRETL